MTDISIHIDSAIQSTSLAAYIRLHPFARTMEWLFNERVLHVLFDTACQDVNKVNSATADSSLITSILLSVQVMNAIMDLQPTYLDLVRPLVKIKANGTRVPVGHSVIASFEDEVSNKIQLVTSLGLYCGTGHQELTVASLKLLEKLSNARKLVSPTPHHGRKANYGRMLAAVEKDSEAERIAHALASAVRPDARELEAGPESTGYIIKCAILDFLYACLNASPNTPALAHILLGFSCRDGVLEIPDGGLFAQCKSLFHAVVELAVYYPAGDGSSYLSWLTGLKQGCMRILRQLWTSSLSSSLTMLELRRNTFLFDVILRSHPLTSESLWEGSALWDEQFFNSSGSKALEDMLHVRHDILDYSGRELRSLSRTGLTTLQSQVQSSLLGVTTLPNGQQVPNLSIFDMFDYVSFSFGNMDDSIPSSEFVADIDFAICLQGVDGFYNIPSVEQVLLLKRNEVNKNSVVLASGTSTSSFNDEASRIIEFCKRHNQMKLISKLQKDVLRTWVQTVIMLLQSCEKETNAKSSLVLRVLQVILPVLEKAYFEDGGTAMALLRLAKCAVDNVDYSSSSFEGGNAGDFATDKILQTFKVVYNGIFAPATTSELRELCYQLGYSYLRGIATRHLQLTKYLVRFIKSTGDQTLDIICDDAYSGRGPIKISALMLLDSLISISISEKSTYVLLRIAKYNFIGVLIDVIKGIAAELQTISASDIPLLLSYYEASFAVLVRIAQTRLGATHLLNAGIFRAVSDSGLFTVDPDLGLEFDSPNAHKKYFDLLLAVLRIINATILSVGPENDTMITQALEFLSYSRTTMVAIFKRYAKVGGLQVGTDYDLAPLVDAFTLLVSLTGFLNVSA
jgi:nuclear pore complex protein Nup205